jgi:AraC-like DNA-binding protein
VNFSTVRRDFADAQTETYAMISPTSDFAALRFSTDKLPPAERVPRWYELFGRSVARRWCIPSSTSCHTDLTVWSLARGLFGTGSGLCVQRVAITGGIRSERTPDLLADGNDDIAFTLQMEGCGGVSQCNRETTVEPGTGILTSNADPSKVILPGASRFVIIGIPRKLLRTSVTDIEDRFAQPLRPHRGALRLLAGYADLLEEEGALDTPELRRAAATHIYDLCVLALGTTGDAAEIAKGRGLRAARLRAIKNDIAENLACGDLSVASLARRQRITPRYIHRLFESEGVSLSRYVLGLRLTRVHRLLTDGRHADLAISTIAYSAGFNDLSTFNREFRRYFGATPSDVRHACL